VTAPILYCVEDNFERVYNLACDQVRKLLYMNGLRTEHSVETMLALIAMVAIQTSPSLVGQTGRLIEHVPCASDPSQTYTLYLPSAYTNTRTWPLLLVFDPGARAARAADVFREAAERYGWIVAASETSRNGPWEPTRRAITAMWPALLQSYAIDERRIYAAGHSGGAVVAWTLARQTGQVAGVIASGPPDPGGNSIPPPGFAWFGTAGRSDFNFIEAKDIDGKVARTGSPHRVEFFDGGHQWLPGPLAIRALGWLEVVAMQQGRRPRDQQIAAAILAEDLARARELESAGFLTDAHRTYARIVESYSGLANIGEAAARVTALEADDRFKSARRDEQRSDARERARIDALIEVDKRLTGHEEVSAADLHGLDIEGLQKAAGVASYEGRAALRSLETIFMNTGEVVRQLEDRREYARAALALELAVAIHPDRQRVWFDLAAARAASGARGSAITALRRAVALGFDNLEALTTDPRFNALRSSRDFAQIAQTLQKK
jgi:hypothetical protein